MTKRTHRLTVHIDPQLFDEVRAMLSVDYAPSRSRDSVPYGSWPDLIELVLREWLTAEYARRRDVQPAEEFTP